MRSDLFPLVIAGSPSTNICAMNRAIDIQESLSNIQAQVQPTVGQSVSLVLSRVPHSQPFRHRSLQIVRGSGRDGNISRGPVRGFRQFWWSEFEGIGLWSVQESIRLHSVMECRARAMFVGKLDTSLGCVLQGNNALTYRIKVLLEVLRRDRIPLLSPNDQVISHRKRLGLEDLLNLSTRDLNKLK
ncbi:hypothetical protein F511_39581 [Dorcoceras hygrometricum]|uniref:Uncharacterized protein n=1 Tax=Dorcoceras hygrometricum TaxID=472368 RepID=A0A2Z7B209_9LAMI|nr:hypothetical protein F511_39581 [Dorcoceras hygrometricum]